MLLTAKEAVFEQAADFRADVGDEAQLEAFFEEVEEAGHLAGDRLDLVSSVEEFDH